MRASLKEITVAKRFPLNTPSLLVLGGIEYDRAADGQIAEATVHRGTTRDLVRSRKDVE